MVANAQTAAPVTYTDETVRGFALAAVLWGVVGMLVGVVIAAQLAFPDLTYGISWLSYGRLRPLHTNAVIFAFGGCALFATSYHVVQRTCQVPLFLPALAKFTFWGWQAVIVLAAITLPAGMTAGKEYAELEWPIDLLIAVVWVSYAIVFLGTLVHRGGANRSRAPRLAFSNQYCQPWARPQESFLHGVPIERVRHMSARVRALLGYSIHPPFMGHVNGMHPERVLDPAYESAIERADRDAGVAPAA